MSMTRPDAAAAWSRAASIPDGPGWHQGQEQLRSWIGQQIAAAAQAGQIDPNNRAQLSEFLGTLGATPEAGGGRYIYKMFMGQNPTDGWAGNAALAKYARIAPGGTGNPAPVAQGATLGTLAGAHPPQALAPTAFSAPMMPASAPMAPMAGATLGTLAGGDDDAMLRPFRASRGSNSYGI